MSSSKAAATLQGNTLLVQYSPTGTGIGSLYAFLLPESMQRRLDSTTSIASLSLASVPHSSGINEPGSSPPSPPRSTFANGGGPSAAAITAARAISKRQEKPSSPEDAARYAAVVAAPFRDIVLAINGENASPQVWHIRPPTYSSQDIPVSSPSSDGDGSGPDIGSATPVPGSSSWTASRFASSSSSFLSNAMTVHLGTHNPENSKAGILAVEQGTNTLQMTKFEYISSSGNVASPPSQPSTSPSPGGGYGPIQPQQQPPNPTAIAWNQTWTIPVSSWQLLSHTHANVFHPVTVSKATRGGGEGKGYSEAIVGPCFNASEALCMSFWHDPPASSSAVEYYPPLGPACYTSTQAQMVAVDGPRVFTNDFLGIKPTPWALISPNSFVGEFQGPVVACAATDDFIVAVVPGVDSSQPDIHLFHLESKTWIRTLLVSAPAGTFDSRPIPPGNEGGNGNYGPGMHGPESANGSRQQSPALIGGIVGGIVVVAALVFAALFYKRRRGANMKAHQRNLFAMKPLVGHDALGKQQRMRTEGAAVTVPRADNVQETIVSRSLPPLQVATSVAPPISSSPTATTHPYDQNTLSAHMTSGTTLIPPNSGTIGMAGDKGEITDREIQTISLRPSSAVGTSHGSLFSEDDDNLEIVTHVSRSRSNIRGAGGSSHATTPISGHAQTWSDSTAARPKDDGQEEEAEVRTETITTEPITPALAHAQLILQESQRRSPMHQPPVPPMHSHYAAYQHQQQQPHQRQYPSQPGTFR